MGGKANLFFLAQTKVAHFFSENMTVHSEFPNSFLVGQIPKMSSPRIPQERRPPQGGGVGSGGIRGEDIFGLWDNKNEFGNSECTLMFPENK